jgi:predicted acylesterase/phospholipase RssA
MSDRSNESWKPTAIIIGPGGLKGFIYLGAMRILEEYGWLENVTSYLGVSVGSVISMLLICGYNIEEIIKIANRKNFTGDIINAVARLLNLNSLVPDKGIINLLEEKMVEKFNKSLTLKELYDMTHMDFTTVARNADTGNIIYFNYKTHPNVNVVLAVAASIGIPGAIPLTEYDDDILVDGAVGDPYPTRYYAGTNHKVLGLYVDSVAPKRIERIKGFGAEILKVVRTYIAIISHMQHDKYVDSKINAPSNVRHLILLCMNNISLDANLSIDDKADMLLSGWDQADNFIKSI